MTPDEIVQDEPVDIRVDPDATEFARDHGGAIYNWASDTG
jgi:hypothetical protein